MALKFKEKKALTNECLGLLKTGASESELYSFLISRSVSKFDIPKILSSARKRIDEEYVDRIKEHLLLQNLQNHLDDFEWVDNQKFEELQIKALEQIKRDCDLQVGRLLRQGLSAQDIHDNINNDYYSVEDVNARIALIEYRTQPHKNSGAFRAGGTALILLGIIMTIASTGQNSYTIYYGLIISGIVLLVNSFRTQQDLDNKL